MGFSYISLFSLEEDTLNFAIKTLAKVDPLGWNYFVNLSTEKANEFEFAANFRSDKVIRDICLPPLHLIIKVVPLKPQKTISVKVIAKPFAASGGEPIYEFAVEKQIKHRHLCQWLSHLFNDLLTAHALEIKFRHEDMIRRELLFEAALSIEIENERGGSESSEEFAERRSQIELRVRERFDCVRKKSDLH